MLLDDATSWKGDSEWATSRARVQRRGMGTRKDRDEGSPWGLTFKSCFHQLIIWPVVQGHRCHEIKVRHSRLFFSISFFSPSRLLPSDLDKVWTVKRTRDEGVERTCCQVCVERWRGPSRSWWPHPPHGGSVAVAGGCCHSIDAELRSGGKTKAGKIKH